MKVIFTFSDSSTYESSIIRQGFSCQEILFNRLQASDGFVGFSIPFSTTFSNKMTADINNNVLAVVYDDNNNPYATGFVKKEVGYEQKYRNQPIKITIVSKSYMLDKTLNESYALESYTSAQIVTWLLTQAGISDIGSLSSMTTTVPLFVFNAGENIKDVLKEFCFEYSKTFYFDKNGYFQVADLFISSFTASQTFNRSNIRDRVNINVKEAEANCIRGRWTPLSLVNDTLVFEDKQNATSQYDCVIPIAANSWFGGVEDNFLKCDSTLGEVKYVKLITQNNIQSDSGITKTLDLLERTSLNQLHFTAQNTTASVKNITKMQVYANAYIAKENRVDVTTYGNKEKELSLKYIQDQTTAQNFVKALADYYNSTSFTVSFSSDEVCNIGDLVTVSADGIGSFNCRIIQRTRNIITDTIDYVCENIGDYTPAVIVQTVQEPLAVNIAGGQKGLDGAPGTPGANGKNAITMTSSTTPSGEYNGQMGFWQGQPYMWNGSSWVKQVGDLPTDAVLHYSFDEVPDYPDGTAIEKHIKDFTSVPSGWDTNNRGALSVANGEFINTVTNGTNAWFRRYFSSGAISGIVKVKVRASINCQLFLQYYSTTYVTLASELNAIANQEYTFTVSLPSTQFILVQGYTPTATDFQVVISEIYIGDGSYATPIIDNSNGQFNATNNGGIAVQGVSGKGAYFLNGKYADIGTDFQLNANFTVSLWVKPDNNTQNLNGDIIAKYSQFILRNGAGASWGNYLMLYLYGENETLINSPIIDSLLTPNVWSNIIIVRNELTCDCYINGVKVKTFTLANNTIRKSTNPFTICGSTMVVNTRPQSVDDLLIFNRALSDTEVQALYQNKGNTPKYYDLSDYSLEAIDNDSKISPSEKIELLSKWKEIYNAENVSSSLPTTNISATGEYKALIDDATTVGIAGLEEVTAYKNASNAIRDVLWNSSTGYLIPANINKVSDVTAGALDSLFSTYRQCLQKARTKISQQQASIASALTVSNSNPYCLIPVSGSTINYSNTGNRLQVFNGTTLLTPKASSATLGNNEWKVTADGGGAITAGSQTVTSTYIDFGNVSNMTQDTATVTYTITVKVNNVENTMYAVQKFAKSVASADGVSYSLIATAYVVKTGTSVKFDAKKNTGGTDSNYSDGYLYSSPDGTVWTQVGQFKNGTAYNSKTVTVSADTIFRLCKSASPSDFVDELSVNIFKDGEAGHSPTVTATKTGTQTTIYVDEVEQATIDDGTNGTNTWNSSASATSSTTSIALNTITVITGHSVSAGDLIIANGLLFYVTAVGSTTATVTYKQKIKGDTGGTGNFTKRIPLYYVNDSTSTPNVPTTRVTSTTPATGKTWTQGKYNTYSVGKYYFTCDQIETYNASGTYQSCSWSTVSRDTEYENACVAKLRSAGQYIGTKSASFTAYTGSNNWDWFLATANFTQQSVSIVSGNVYVWNGSTWSIDSDTSHLAGALNDMVALVDTYVTDDTSVGAYARLFAKTLAVQQAFIDELMTNAITVNEYIQSSNYSQASETVSGAGYKLNKNGKISANELEVNGMSIQAKGATNSNLALGYHPMHRVTTGVANIALGMSTGNNITTGDNNVAIGMSALTKAGTTADTTGDNNVVIGNNAGKNITSGYGNIVLGNQAGDDITTAHDNIAIGNSSINKNKIVSIGNTIGGTPTKIQDNAVLIGHDLNVNSSSNLNKYVNINNVIQYINGTLKIDSKSSPTGGLTADVLASLKSVAYTANGNCLKLSDDLMIQWGKTDNLGSCSPTGTKTATITFGEGVLQTESFYNNNYAVIVSLEGSTSGMEMAVYDKSKDGFKIIGYNRNTNSTISNVIFHWLAIGSA